MDRERALKPSYAEWLRWSKVVIDRLTTAAHVYCRTEDKTPRIPAGEKQIKVAQIVEIVRRLHLLTDENEEAASRNLIESEHYSESVIADLAPVMTNLLRRLPAISHDVQILLDSPWFADCKGPIADTFFRGPGTRHDEGVGSGHPAHGRLPEALQSLLQRERVGAERADSARRASSGDGDRTSPRQDASLPRRWVSQNGSFLRTAGRLD